MSGWLVRPCAPGMEIRLGSTFAPSRTRWMPFTMTQSSGFRPSANDLQAIAQPAELDVAAFDDVLVVDDVDELAALVRSDRPFGDHQIALWGSLTGTRTRARMPTSRRRFGLGRTPRT